jgi:hypothetical protein
VAVRDREVLPLVAEEDVELAGEFVRLGVVLVELDGLEDVVERLAVVGLVVEVDGEIVLRLALALRAVDPRAAVALAARDDETGARETRGGGEQPVERVGTHPRVVGAKDSGIQKTCDGPPDCLGRSGLSGD